MLENLYYLLIAVFAVVYVLKALLLVGYNHFKYKSKSTDLIITELLTIMITLKPIAQKRLEPKGYDFKVYKRYQAKNGLYYAILWVCLFLILFLSAKIHLGMF
jgi:hypothetical protein